MLIKEVFAQTNLGPPPAGIGAFQDLFLRFINLSVGFAFMVLTVMFVYGGIKYIISSGDQKALQSAQQTITWAVVGLVFMVLAWLVLRLISAVTGTDVTIFCLGYDC